MTSRTLDWLDERTGWRAVYAATLDRMVPKVNWLYTLGSATLFLALTQAVTGILLTLYYVPTPQDAYSSIQYIMNGLSFGWLIRGIHYWGATLMVVCIYLHLFRVFFTAAYKYPREVTWVTGVILFLTVQGMGFTGYLLPWDQRAYWATEVGTAIAGTVPFIGGFILQVLRAGPDLSYLTLTRFFGVHIWVLPAILFSVIGVHLYLIIRNGISTVPKPGE